MVLRRTGGREVALDFHGFMTSSVFSRLSSSPAGGRPAHWAFSSSLSVSVSPRARQRVVVAWESEGGPSVKWPPPTHREDPRLSRHTWSEEEVDDDLRVTLRRRIGLKVDDVHDVARAACVLDAFSDQPLGICRDWQERRALTR